MHNDLGALAGLLPNVIPIDASCRGNLSEDHQTDA